MQNAAEHRTTFSTNWNNKLCCQVFTTIRFSDRWTPGQHTEVYLGKKLLGTAVVVDATRYASIQSVPECVCYTDTGYNRANTVGIIARMYPNDPNATRKPLFMVTLEWVEGSLTNHHLALFSRAEQLSLF